MKERDIVIAIDSSVDTMKEAGIPEVSDNQGENSVSLLSNTENVGGISPDLCKNAKKEKGMSMSAKKPPKPPRPPRGLSLDAADQKLIKELAELAMIKRARIERMKALKKMKAAKASSASATSSGNLIAMVFTILFCIVIIFQGCHPSGILLGNSPPKSYGAAESNIVTVQDQLNLSTSGVPLSGIKSPNLIGLVPASDNEGKKATN
ncbi:hypothetical protein CDL12_04019 [Handroanthus impetiginosus]|uniref:Transmembrane protein n=1 Tax=Handroanthus impetiginosus TaxID=429701 RepID=A0A2G9I0H7_9LAMI|nr:hypothetical protein CDL12_04019 [Handroanthus impetiginosus]